MDFFIENVNLVFHTNFLLLHILLPLGISFFTFHQLAFIVDSYHHKRNHPNFLDYSNFVTFFPQLIAGPIVFPSEMLPQFEDKKNKVINYNNLSKGFMLFSLGLAKKVFIADSIAVFANAGFDTVNNLTLAEGWLTSLSYTMQLYFDFSGYCDMAIGIAFMFNIELPLNFNAPYRSEDFQDFWRRWHITLGRFMAQYLYIPLGGNRHGNNRTLLNLMIVFLVSGIWHGAGWTFVLWGALHGIGILIHRIWKGHGYSMNRYLGIAITFFFVNILWVFFRSTSLSCTMKVLKGMFGNFNLALTDNYTSQLSSLFQNKYNMLIFFASIILAFFGKTAYELSITGYNRLPKRVFTVTCFLISVLLLNRVVTFLYFNF
jgi:alginate O-acetyltransferase complex protein AlgI